MAPFVIAILLWPIIIFGGMRLLSSLLMPFFNLTYNNSNLKSSLLWADIFHIVTLILLQILLIVFVKLLYNYYEISITKWLIIPFGILCIIFGPRWFLDHYLQNRYEPWKEVNLIEKHIAWSWTIGLEIGWIIATIMLIMNVGKI